MTHRTRTAGLGLFGALLAVVLASCSMELQPTSEELAAETPAPTETPEAPQTPETPETPGTPETPETPEPAGPTTPGPSTPAPTSPPRVPDDAPVVTISGSSTANGGSVDFRRTGDTSSPLSFRILKCGPFTSTTTEHPCGLSTSVPVYRTFATAAASFNYRLGGQSGEHYHVEVRPTDSCRMSPCDAYIVGAAATVTVVVS